jgi:hypothetical protein
MGATAMEVHDSQQPRPNIRLYIAIYVLKKCIYIYIQTYLFYICIYIYQHIYYTYFDQHTETKHACAIDMFAIHDYAADSAAYMLYDCLFGKGRPAQTYLGAFTLHHDRAPFYYQLLTVCTAHHTYIQPPRNSPLRMPK